MEVFYVGSLVEVINVAILFKIHFTQKMGSLCRWAPVMVHICSTFYILSRSVLLFS
jgi:hypothetical protein